LAFPAFFVEDLGAAQRAGFASGPVLSSSTCEARNLALPPPMPRSHRDLRVAASRNSSEAARRLFRAGRPIAGTPAAAYLAHRGLTAIASPWLRYHPCCYVRASDEVQRQTWPALLAALTDVHGVVRGVHRTWLDPSRCGLAPIRAPRRSLGRQLGHGVRFGGFAAHLLVAGEGLETVLSLRAVLPRVPVMAGLSANHLAALALPGGVQRLYIARDGDAAGTRAAERLRAHAEAAGVLDVRDLYPMHGDFNDDLRRLGAAWLAGHVGAQLDPADVRWLHHESGETARAA
jgi:hypothetical protein